MASDNGLSGVTREQIKTVKDAKSAREMAIKFSGEEDPKKANQYAKSLLSKCGNLVEMKERLDLAWKKENGQMKDLQYFGKLMEDLKKEDQKNREKMVHLFEELETILDKADSNLHQQLQAEDATKGYRQRLAEFKQGLHQEKCPVVVVGQVSSGKSSLLNLFLGDDYLPSQLMSCTASICELTYAETPQAKLLHPNGKEEMIAFEEKDNYIFKKDGRDERYQHEAIRLALPVPFLRSGTVLIDTPGIGENQTMEHVLLEYVEKHDVFGFIFVIKCNDSGGVLQRFKNLIRKLSEIKDKYGQRKMEPKAVLFVANFWDLVPADEQEMTKHQIISTLQKEQCLSGFDPDKQLFFMNTKFSWATWKAGLISNDYYALIHGIQDFFPIGHKRKLEIAYLWYERLLDKILHPLRVYIASAKKTRAEVSKEVKQIQKDFIQLEKKVKESIERITQLLKMKATEVKKHLKVYLQSEEAKSELGNWKSSDIYKEEEGDSWLIIEEHLEACIEEKLSNMLETWESENKHFKNAREEVFAEVETEFKVHNAFLRSLEKRAGTSKEPDFNRESWGYDTNVNSATASTSSEDQVDGDEYGEELHAPFRTQIDWAKVVPQRSADDVKRSFVTGNSVIQKLFGGQRRMASESRQESYRRDKKAYMKERSLELIQHVLRSSGEGSIDAITKQQMEQLEVLIDTNVEELRQGINKNRSLLKGLKRQRQSKETLEKIYQPMEEKLSKLFEKTIYFRLQSLLLFDILKPYLKRIPSESLLLSSGIFGDVQCLNMEKPNCKPQKVTGKRYKQAITCSQGEAILEYRDIFFHLYNLSVLQGVGSFIPKFVGLAQQGPCLVFEHFLRPASFVFQNSSQRIDRDVFLDAVANGVKFLHDRDLVHMDLCLDSLLVTEDGKPILPNPYYRMPVPFPTDLVQSLGNYAYMPPEVFPYNSDRPAPMVTRNRESFRLQKEERYYTSSADVYGLSMITSELMVDLELFKAFKEKTILQYMEQGDPTKLLHNIISEAKKKKNVNNPQRLQLCIDCIKVKASDRKTITEWIENWNKYRR